jgi:hypothetical protein
MTGLVVVDLEPIKDHPESIRDRRNTVFEQLIKLNC